MRKWHTKIAESAISPWFATQSTCNCPPFGRLALVHVSATDELAAREASAAHASGVEVLGPAEAPIARLRNRYRQQILLKHREAAAVWRVAERVAAAAERLPRAQRVTLDVNPLDML